jgi:hypothetical protein
LEYGDENVPPNWEEAMTRAMKIASSNPMRDIIRKSRTKALKALESDGFKACVQE